MEKIKSLQSLRALAFIEVFLGHCGISPFFGAFGVSVFFVLSGFCMAVNYIPKIEEVPRGVRGSILFALGKVKKLYFLHIVMTLLSFVLRGVPQSTGDILRLIINVLLLQSLFPRTDVYFAYNGISWYLSTYMFICLFAPAILRAVSHRTDVKQVMTAAALVISVMLLLGVPLSVYKVPVGDDFAKWFTYICPASRILDFTLGALFGQMYLVRGKSSISAGKTAALALAALIYLSLYDLVVRSGAVGFQYGFFFAPATVLFMLAFSLSGGAAARLLTWKPLVALGDLSSSAFLIHQLSIQGLRVLAFLPSGITSLTALASAAFALTMVLAYIYSRLSKTAKIMA